MATVLHIEASPRGDESYSTQVARAFLAAYQKSHPGDWVDTLNVFTGSLPEFDAPAAKAKYAVLGGQLPAGPAEKKWREVIEIIDHFMEADKLVISSPMWNFGVPYRLKQYLDVIVQPGLTFKYEAGKYTGLVTGRPAMLVLARGGQYPANTPSAGYDMQRPYLEMILRYMGFENIQSLVIEPTLEQGPEGAKKAADSVAAEAGRLAESF